MSFEESLVTHAAPTLASIKIANLYSFRFCSVIECHENIQSFNEIMNPKGIYVELLKNVDDFYLIYVYRKSHLQKNLNEKKIKRFLRTYGYSGRLSIKEYLEVLKKRLSAEKEFPHEIGVFLGYPLEDVRSFIDPKGAKCLICGDWQVYHDVQTARCLFCRYKHCKETYLKTYKSGRRFCDMIVSA